MHHAGADVLDLPLRGHSAETSLPQARIVIADDHPLVRKALAEAAQIACPDACIEEVETLAELLALLRKRSEVTLVLLDLRLPDASGFSGLRTLRERFPFVPVAIVSALEDDLTINGAIDLGALGFIPKSARLADLTEAITTIHEGEVWTPRDRPPASCPSERLALAGLTPAQLRIVGGLKRGLLNKQIAFELGVTEHTVKAHMTAAFRKLGVTNRMQAMVLLGSEPAF